MSEELPSIVREKESADEFSIDEPLEIDDTMEEVIDFDTNYQQTEYSTNIFYDFVPLIQQNGMISAIYSVQPGLYTKIL